MAPGVTILVMPDQGEVADDPEYNKGEDVDCTPPVLNGMYRPPNIHNNAQLIHMTRAIV